MPSGRRRWSCTDAGGVGISRRRPLNDRVSSACAAGSWRRSTSPYLRLRWRPVRVFDSWLAQVRLATHSEMGRRPRQPAFPGKVVRESEWGSFGGNKAGAASALPLRRAFSCLIRPSTLPRSKPIGRPSTGCMETSPSPCGSVRRVRNLRPCTSGTASTAVPTSPRTTHTAKRWTMRQTRSVTPS